MNSTNIYNTNNSFESLRYDTLLSSKEFKIDFHNNLHIIEESALKSRDEIIHIDQLSPTPVIKKRTNQSLLALGLASILVSSVFSSSALFMGQLWAIGFAIVFCVFGIATIIASRKNSTTVHQYNHVISETALFTISEPSFKDKQVTHFLNALNNKIEHCRIKDENEYSSYFEENLEDNIDDNIENNRYKLDKQSQYTKHLDFLFNHGIVDEVLYDNLLTRINQKIDDSENRFMTIESNKESVDEKNSLSNVINFPVNA